MRAGNADGELHGCEVLLVVSGNDADGFIRPTRPAPSVRIAALDFQVARHPPGRLPHDKALLFIPFCDDFHALPLKPRQLRFQLDPGLPPRFNVFDPRHFAKADVFVVGVQGFNWDGRGRFPQFRRKTGGPFVAYVKTKASKASAGGDDKKALVQVYSYVFHRSY